MLGIRMLAAAAMLALAASGAAAQTAPGRPMPLLQILQAPAQATPQHHHQTIHKAARRTAKKTRFAGRSVAKRRHVLAKAEPSPPPVLQAPQATAATGWPAPNAAAAATVPASAWPNAAPVADAGGVEPGTASTDAGLSEIVVDGQTVQVASPGSINDIDRAAGQPTAAGDATAKGKIATASPALASAPATMAAAPPADPVGSASWIAKLLAALGGAVAAGSAAWFMIGSSPQRPYREADDFQDTASDG
jgi:hypothetical protein